MITDKVPRVNSRKASTTRSMFNDLSPLGLNFGAGRARRPKKLEFLHGKTCIEHANLSYAVCCLKPDSVILLLC